MADINDINDLVTRGALEFAIEDIDEALEVLPNRLKEVAGRAAVEGKEFWSEEAGRRLNTTRNRYQAALYIQEDFGAAGGLTIGMHPTDKLVIAIEEGAPGFDLKPGFLKGAARRVIPIPNPPKDMRVVTDQQGSDKWMHPGWDGMNLVDETDKQLDDVIIPKHLNELFDKL